MSLPALIKQQPSEHVEAAAEVRDDQRESVETLAQRDRWVRLLLRSVAIGDGDKVLGSSLANHLNIKTGRCDPSYEALAVATAKTVTAIPKQLNRLEGAGFMKRHSSGGRHRNQYELIFPKAESVTAVPNANKRQPERVATPAENPGFEQANPIRSAERTPETEPGEPYTTIRTSNREGENTEENREGDTTTRDAFEDFWKQYPKRVGKGAARKAFMKALKKGAALQDIMTGVFRYGAARINQDPKYTKHPAAWLNDERWLDEPEPQFVQQQSRAGSASEGIRSYLEGEDILDVLARSTRGDGISRSAAMSVGLHTPRRDDDF
ncbi:MAG: hypothetical protein HY852_00410 [Bradyrhizobium sp.]|uniref:hypothetical protein n=1 Tax=Bradyrhizobium sp. TaxID=376 RepID=UPI0025B8F9ED|nr:hypothetical protein [Bradyrhizobium sp.]MBI5260263.1 hypothetical protein [Bradyrhizobium sp.]